VIHRLFSYVTLGFSLLIFLGLPQQASDPIRAYAVAAFAPAWHVAHRFKTYLYDRPFFHSSDRLSVESSELQIESQGLKSQLETQLAWKDWTQHIESQLASLQQLKIDVHQPFFQRRWEEMNDLVQRQFFAILAPVIYRDPSSWSSSLWIQAGQKDNESLGRVVVGKNSPVVVGSSLVGVVEFVGWQQSRVRLITDSGLIVSVRVARGKWQDRELSRQISFLEDRIGSRQDLPLNPQEKAYFLSLLQRLQQHTGSEDGYYAKGHLQGSSSSFWRARGLTLKGVGFNYDYPDQEGPSRQLQTGKPIGVAGVEVPILQEGDLLVTSGLDGVFPAGIQVGIVTGIKKLSEGSYAYNLEARPTASHFNDLQNVFILPPLTLE
jgi:rod shape-determining protein MreC